MYVTYNFFRFIFHSLSDLRPLFVVSHIHTARTLVAGLSQPSWAWEYGNLKYIGMRVGWLDFSFCGYEVRRCLGARSSLFNDIPTHLIYTQHYQRPC